MNNVLMVNLARTLEGIQSMVSRRGNTDDHNKMLADT